MILLLAFFLIADFNQATIFYEKGIEEKDTFLRNKDFNLVVEELLKTPVESFEENALMGESLLQLRQYPLALFYFLEAMQRDLENQEVKKMIQETIRLGNLQAVVKENFHSPQWLWLCVLLTLFLSGALWVGAKSKLIKKLALFATLPLFLSLIYLIFHVFRQPILAVIIHSSILLQEPSDNAASVSSTPIPGGMVVTVLDVQKSGAWVKIRSPVGTMGYLPEKSLRIVN